MRDRQAREDDPGVAELHVGTYSEAGALYPLRLSPPWSLGGPYHGAPNPSFGACSRRHGLHYLVDERPDGLLRAFRRKATGWEPLARVPTGGSDPCYVALDAEERWLAVANYGSGSIALLGLDPRTGLPGDPAAVLANRGGGPVADRQEGPHTHCAIFSPDGKWLYGVDLGTDEVLAFPFDPDRGSLGERSLAFRMPPGSGPRHLVFHPHRPIAFLVTELTSSLAAFDVAGGTLSLRQRISAVPPNFAGESLGGHLAVNAAGDRVYVSNRGHDSIAVFAFDEAGGLSPLQYVPSGGASPRFFLLLECQHLFVVANEEGNSAAVFEIAPDGRLQPLARVPVPRPAFVFSS